MKRHFILCLYVFLLFNISNDCFSEIILERDKPIETPPDFACREFSIWQRPYLKGNWKDRRQTLEDHGFVFSSSYVFDLLSNSLGGEARGMAFAGSLEIDIDFEKFSPLKGLKLYASASARTGTDLSADKIGNQFSVAQAYGGQNV